jgi:hypothetical protein
MTEKNLTQEDARGVATQIVELFEMALGALEDAAPEVQQAVMEIGAEKFPEDEKADYLEVCRSGVYAIAAVYAHALMDHEGKKS